MPRGASSVISPPIDRGQRLHVLGTGVAVEQHHRVVVAQARQVAEGGQQRRAEPAVERGETVARALAGHVKDRLVLEFCGHVHRGLCLE